MATTGDLELATTGDHLTATDTRRLSLHRSTSPKMDRGCGARSAQPRKPLRGPPHGLGRPTRRRSSRRRWRPPASFCVEEWWKPRLVLSDSAPPLEPRGRFPGVTDGERPCRGRASITSPGLLGGGARARANGGTSASSTRDSSPVEMAIERRATDPEPPRQLPKGDTCHVGGDEVVYLDRAEPMVGVAYGDPRFTGGPDSRPVSLLRGVRTSSQ